MQHVSWNGSSKKERMKYSFDGITNRQFSELVDDWIKDKRSRQILKDRFIDGMTFDELSEKYHLSDRHVKRIVYSCCDKLFQKI